MDLEINTINITDPGTKATANRKWRRKDEIFMMHNREGILPIQASSCFQIPRCERETKEERRWVATCEREKIIYFLRLIFTKNKGHN